ncbi:monofunctional biosynthetic peptidoglycan transglycosylase [Acinetobacter indicus]|jgi:monofunctional biosynthetic peptidoglycan transglycosylase|uniref:Biosynthetic peptidoglycan transglycosylase n=1 Tax=Acinetobacter indicus TaxID=756892 RepID=A0A0F3LNW6_9GAMM|nr:MULTISPECIES: monofunctional biosynthetic peptidoglycan transglycosylase [Acinetobacter]AVH13579.1 monofunctional biosynthetic peptidoglycan transglycosylase [Acinetobacter indicus]KJV44019.1 peptidoglycan transglycosylase [Acinetobacter indicus]MCO8087740.1 monofunctional biosynthetic peptidoglycan transglycosylase [Acinetobacter indicus]MCO8101385.1 monofunctional biosynthetic peptidoglycan transglycosylase [Acinetobacter indicus]MCP0915837.1 monofunctional biosynthetic peptidoglycan tran
MKAFIVRTLLILVSLFLLIQLWIFSSLAWWRTQPVQSTMMMRLDYWSDTSQPIRHEWRDYDQISEYLKKAVVAAEDGKFMQHHGFDWEGIQHALERNKDQGQVVAGGSTISQQLAKNLFLFNQRSFLRKGQEAIATWMMERMWSKQRILEVYLNSVEFGDNIYGIEAATQHYFGKSSRSLSREEAIFLAAILPNPKYYQDNRSGRGLEPRKRMIRKYMRYSEIP